MKQILVSMTMLLVLQQIFAQHKDTLHTLPPTDFASKSKNQKSAAWVLLGGGTVLVAGGLLIGNRKESTFADAGTGAVIGALGVISALGSIPVFLAAGRNHRKAIGSARIGLQRFPSLVRSPAYSTLHPAVYFRISL